MPELHYWILGMVALASVCGQAGEPIATVVVPYDGERPLEEQRDGSVLIGRECLESLRNRGRESEPPSRWTHATFTLRFSESGLEGVYEASLFVPDAGSVVLRCPKATSKIWLNGEGAHLVDGVLAVPRRGVHRVRFSVRRALLPDWETIDLEVPCAATAVARVFWPGGDEPSRVSFGEKDVLTLKRPPVRAPLDDERAITQEAWTHRLRIDAGVESLEAVADLSFPESRRSVLNLRVGEEWSVSQLEAAGLRAWKREGDLIRLQFDPAPAGALRLQLEAERLWGSDESLRPVPRFEFGARRREVKILFYHSAKTELDWELFPPWKTRADDPPRENEAFHFAGTVAAAGSPAPLMYDVRAVSHRGRVHLDHCYTYHGDHFSILTSGYFEGAGELPSLDFELTDGHPLVVTGKTLRGWSSGAGRLRLQFDDPHEGNRFLVRWRSDSTGVALPWLACADDMLASTHSVTLTSLVGSALRLEGAREPLPIDSLPWHIPARYERHAYVLAKEPLRMIVDSASETVAIEQQIRVDVGRELIDVEGTLQWRQAPAGANRRIRLLAHPAVVELSLKGRGITRKRRLPHAEGWVYQFDIAGAPDGGSQSPVALTALIEAGEGSLELPAWSVLGVEEITTSVVLEHAGGLRLRTETEGSALELEEGRRFHLHDADAIVRVASYALKAFDDRPGRVRLADLTTLVYPSGDMWHEATYHLNNKRLQYLSIRALPGFVIRTVHVDGVVAPLYQSADKTTLHVPLNQRQVLALNASKVTILAHRQGEGYEDGPLPTFELLNLVPERTLWHVGLPETWNVKTVQGNLEKSHRIDQLEEILRRYFEALDEIVRVLPTLGGDLYQLALTEYQQIANEIDVELLHLEDGARPWRARVKEMDQRRDSAVQRQKMATVAAAEADADAESEPPQWFSEITPKGQSPEDAARAGRWRRDWVAQARGLSLPAPVWEGRPFQGRSEFEVSRLPQVQVQAKAATADPGSVAPPSPSEASLDSKASVPHREAIGGKPYKIRLPMPGGVMHHYKRGPGLPVLILEIDR